MGLLINSTSDSHSSDIDRRYFHVYYVSEFSDYDSPIEVIFGKTEEDVVQRVARSSRPTLPSDIFTESSNSFLRNIQSLGYRATITLNSHNKELLHLQHILRI